MMFRVAKSSHSGGRKVNQDALHSEESNGVLCCVLADGLGGHAGGAEAARTACEGFLAGFRQYAECSPAAMLTYIGMANRAVRTAQERNPEFAAMRTTIAAVVASGAQAVIGHCGDSRVYVMRDGALSLRTRDHSLVQAMVDAGDLDEREQARHPDRNRLLRCLGEGDEAEPEVSEEPRELKFGDALLLATDGCWEHLRPRELEAEFAKAADPEEWLEGILIRVRRRCFAGGSESSDNYSAIAIMATGDDVDVPRITENCAAEDLAG